MVRPNFRARSLLTASLLSLPALCIVGACSSSSSPPGNVGGNTDNFGDSGIPPVTHHDATTPVKPKDAGHEGAKTDVVVHEAGDVTAPEGDSGTGIACAKDSDCSSHVCWTGAVVVDDDAGIHDAGAVDGGNKCLTDAAKCTCQAPSCMDGVKNGKETDVDCGGPTCPHCRDSDTCLTGSDCVSAECGTGTKGGPCSPADAGAGGCVCEPPSCGDGVQNGTESAIDCGSSGTCLPGEICTMCSPCALGKACAGTKDCLSATCTSMLCSCPVNMAEASTPSGTSYCIDSYEVTFQDYTGFLNTSVAVSTQPAECSWNLSFEPVGLPGEPLGIFTDDPMTYVNWCDALAFCTSVGKHLCGSIGDTAQNIHEGDPVPYGVGDGGDGANNSASVDEWFNACSSQGANSYLYGNSYQPDRCNGIDSPAQRRTGPVEVPPGTAGNLIQVPSGVQSCILDSMCNSPPSGSTVYGKPPTGGSLGGTQTVSCRGGLPGDGGIVPTPSCVVAFEEQLCAIGNPPNILYDMSGNVAEWENSCSGNTGASDTCIVRGGSYDSSPGDTSLTCATGAAQPPLARNTTAADIGFRCCL